MKRLTPQQVETFHREGVLIAEDVLTDDDLAPVIWSLEQWIDQRARALHAEGKIADLHEHEPFERRIAQLWAQQPQFMEGMDIAQSSLRAVHDFHFNEHLLDAVEDLIGPEIAINPIEHIRAKMPAALTDEPNGFENVPWHQDAAVTWEEADESQIVTCWIPLVDATETNGCMRVMPGVNRIGYLAHEKSKAGTTIRSDVFPDHIEPIVAACRRGGVVFMSRHTPHQGLVNRSNHVRWTIDLRYQPTGQPTGRPFHPSFVARSAADPRRVERNYDDWRDRWAQALEKARGIAWHRTVAVDQRIPEARRQETEGT